MFDPRKSDDRKRERSLLAFSAATRQDGAPPKPVSLLTVADAIDRSDPVLRHSRARTRREDAEIQSSEPAAQPEVTASEPEPPMPVRSIAEKLKSRSAPKPADGNDAAAPLEPTTGFDAADRRETGERDRSEDGASDLYWKPLVDPMAVVGGVAKSKLLIAATTVLGAVIGVAIALSTPKTYEASAELLVDPRDLKIVSGELTQSGLPSDATLAIVENQVRVLTSGTVLNKVVDKLDLESDPEFNGEADAGFRLGDIISTLRSLISRQDSSAFYDRRRALAVGNLAKSLDVVRGGKTFVVVISVTTQDGEKSALIANTMTDVFLQTYGEIQSQAAGRAESEITSRLDELRSGVEAAERKVETYKAENDIIDPQGRLITDDEIVNLNGQLSLARARTLELNAKASTARSIDVDAVLGGALPEQIASGSLAELRSQYSALKQEFDRQAVHLGPRHPQRLALESQLAGAREQIGTELRRAVSSLQVELKRAVELEQQLAARLAQLKVKQGDLGTGMVALRELEREAAAKRSVYEAFLLRAKETGEQKDVNSANMSVISTAYPPLDPKGPSRTMMALTGLFLGFVSGLGLGGLRGAYDGLRQNAGVPQRRRRWKRWTSKSDRAAARDNSKPANVHPAQVNPDEASRVDALVRRVAAANAARPDDAEPVTPKVGKKAEAVTTAKPEDAPMTDSHAPHYAPPIHPQMAYAPTPAYPPVYQAGYAPGAVQPQPVYAYPQMHPQPGYPQPYPPQPFHGQAFPFAPAPYPQPHPSMYQGWQPHAPAPYYQQPVQPAGFHQPQSAPQPAAAVDTRQQSQSAENQSQIEEIRESLREFREAVRDFSEGRSRRKFF